MKPIPTNIQTLYADLVQGLHARIERPGSLYTRSKGDGEYAYVKRSVGTTRRDVYIGPASATETSHRIEEIGAENLRAKERRKTISALKAAGVPAPQSALGAVLDALDDAGLLRHTVVVGTAAYQCYPPLVGAVLPAAGLTTQDADLATASLAISADDATESLETILKRADPTFTLLPGLDPKAPPSHFRSASGFIVDLLTPQLRRDDPNPMPLTKLKAGAIPMQYLRWLITDPLQAAIMYSSGSAAFVPQPARYAVHKLIVAQKRTSDRTKRAKDLLQSRALIDILKTRDPYALADARDAALEEGQEGWKTPILRSLTELGLNAAFEPLKETS